MSRPDLSALVSARLCHDLISPMGAIGNGLELLEMSSGAGAEEISLISDSLDTALAKLKFFRVAFGPADLDARLRCDEAREITGAMFNGRVTVVWDTAAHDMPRPLARMIFLAILCLEKSLPMGGLVRVSIAEDTVALTVEGRRIAAPDDLWCHLRDGTPVPDLRPDGVQFALLRQTLDGTGQRAAFEVSESAAEIRFSQPASQPA